MRVGGTNFIYEEIIHCHIYLQPDIPPEKIIEFEESVEKNYEHARG